MKADREALEARIADLEADAIASEKDYQTARDAFDAANATIAQQQAELAEQCRINGMGAQREAKLESDLRQLVEAVDVVCLNMMAQEIGPDPCETELFALAAAHRKSHSITE